MKYYSLLLFCIATGIAQCQSLKNTVSGTIKDRESGETLIGAVVRVKELTATGTTSNEYGFYSITLPQGKYTLIIQYAAYHTDTTVIDLTQTVILDIQLTSLENELEEVEILASNPNDNITNPQTGVEKLDILEIGKIPVLFGEKDIIKTMQLLPGIKSVGDGGGGLYVRGGAGDQNLILLDEALVYNASHLLGFFSTFNSDALKDVTIYKGSQPAQYGGRLSSAMDIRMKDGNKQHFEANGSIGLISSKLSIEGPIVKDKGSFFVSGRRTYADLFLALDKDYKDTKLYFYDLNAKANYRLSKKDQLYLSGYLGRDKLGVRELFGVDWGNATATLRWNHLVSSKLFSNTSAIISNYDYVVGVERGGSDFNLNSNILDYNLKQEFQYYPNTKHSFRFGLSAIYHTIVPGEVSGETINKTSLQKRYSLENAIFVSDEWKPNNRLSIVAGIRFSSFSIMGDGDFYTLDENRNPIDTVHYQSGEFVKTYFNPEPRISGSFRINSSSALKFAYSRNAQYIHLLSNSTVSSPTDKWVPTNNNIKPEIADQLSLGYFKDLKNNQYETSAEIYYKNLLNQIDYKNGADVIFSDQLETQILNGIGRAYGLELFFKKKKGKLTGWISYTLSRTEKKIAGINNDKWYAARQDKTHDLSIVVCYDINERINVSATWVYSTGNAVTFPTGKYYLDQQVVWLYTERNGYRMPDYHRLDIGATIKLKDHTHFSNELAIGIFNAYGRENAYSISFRENENDPSKTEIVQTSLFRFVPSISWNFKIK